VHVHHGITGPKKQESSVHHSSQHRTELTYLEEILQRLQDRHDEYDQVVDNAEKAATDSSNVMQTMLLFH
jgi:hypothetical protein